MLDEVYNPNQIYAQGTDVYRVLQSTYAEFMGLYPPGNPAAPTQGEQTAKGLPPMKVRNSSMKAVIDAYVLIPVYSYMTPSWNDDLRD